jgi:DNA primase large subunit
MTTPIQIRAQKNYTLSDADRLALASLLIKAGYSVRLARENISKSTTAKYEHYVEAWVGTL